MSGWSGWNSEKGREPGPEREPGEERGRAAGPPGGPVTPPPWAYEETRTGPLPPPAAPAGPPAPPPPTWATAPTHAGGPSVPAPVPPPSYGPVPAPRRVPGGRLIALVTAMALVGAGAGFGVWYLGRDRAGTGSPAASAPATGVTVSASAPASTASPVSTTPSVPKETTAAGYRLVRDPVGYTLSVPEGWARRQKQGEKATVVFYDSPSDGRQLQIFELAEATVTESLDLAENDPGYGYAREPGYRALARRSGDTWAELSYRYDDPDKGARRVVDHRFRAADGTLYAIRASGPEQPPRTPPARSRSGALLGSPCAFSSDFPRPFSDAAYFRPPIAHASEGLWAGGGGPRP
ncbi:hypothetical protein [Streptomyces sp. NPDC007905]|uniref:hypothetical protein n=1 Tax=Streptomyces sp. NPDC007905 TaxID=3364788 RepID=UPI0036E1A062